MPEFFFSDIAWLVMTLALVGKFAISFAFQVIYIYMVELLPTEVRLQGLGWGRIMSRFGALFSTFIDDHLDGRLSWLMPVLFGSFSFAAGGSILLMPETNNKPMPDTIKDLDKKQQDEITLSS